MIRRNTRVREQVAQLQRQLEQFRSTQVVAIEATRFVVAVCGRASSTIRHELNRSHQIGPGTNVQADLVFNACFVPLTMIIV